MQTKFWQIEKENKVADVLAQAAQIIKNNGLVAFPTETVYGLGGNGLSHKAIEKIFLAKGRPADNPLILHIGKKEAVCTLVKEVPEVAQKLMDRFWPGPLTLIFKKSKIVPDLVSGGLATVAIRMPENQLARDFIAACEVPLAAPSANISGRPSPTDAQTVQEDLDGKIEAILDGGRTKLGLESTVVDCTTQIPTVLRPGSISLTELKKIVPDCQSERLKPQQKPKAPGMKYRHYAPQAPAYLWRKGQELQEFLLEAKKKRVKLGLIISAEAWAKVAQESTPEDCVKVFADLENLATNLYSWLRDLDKRKVNLILIEEVPGEDLGEAIMNRLSKAAEGKKITALEDFAEIVQASKFL